MERPGHPCWERGLKEGASWHTAKRFASISAKMVCMVPDKVWDHTSLIGDASHCTYMPVCRHRAQCEAAKQDNN